MDDGVTFGVMIRQELLAYAREYKARFIGYNVKYGSQCYGTLGGLEDECIEMPICENLMVGMGIGLAMAGYRPVVCFERHDFLLIGLDQLVNHADKIKMLSNGKSSVPLVVRAIVGGKGPLVAGCQHTQDYTKALVKMLKNTPVLIPKDRAGYRRALRYTGGTRSGTVVIVEYKDNYNKIVE